jgi:transposase
MAKRSFTPEFKQEAVRQVTEEGRSIASVARKLDVSPNLLHRWRRDLKQSPAGAFPGKGRMRPEDEELRRLRREVEDLREENSFLKKAAAYFAKERPRGTK